MTNRDQIIQRIKKLKSHAESAKALGSLEEAEAFAKKVSELLEEYNLSLMEIDATEATSADPFKNWGYAEDISYDDKHLGEWKLLMMSVICKYNFTTSSYNSSRKTIKVYGNIENVDASVWLYHYLGIGFYNLSIANYNAKLAKLKAIDPEEARIFSRTKAYGFKKDFLLGAIEGFGKQLEKRRKEASAKITDLVLYNDKMLQTYMRKVTPNLGKGKPANLTVRNSQAFLAGVIAGTNFKVNDTLSSSSTTVQKKLS